jgi:3-oxoacyl-[acyl-carrier protein] reductase
LARTQLKVVILARDVEKLKKAQEEIEGAEKFERPLEIQQIDISDPANVKSSVAAINSRFQQIELLVHAAGEGPVAPLLETDEALWQKSIQTKLLGTVRLTRAVAPTMVQNNQGSIIIINGAFSKEPHPLFPINSSINCGEVMNTERSFSLYKQRRRKPYHQNYYFMDELPNELRRRNRVVWIGR